MRKSIAKQILEAKGYDTTKKIETNYTLTSKTSLLSDDIINVKTSLLLHGQQILSNEKKILVAYMMIGGISALEKKFLKQIPECRD